MHVYTNGTDWFIARDADDLRAAIVEHHGEGANTDGFRALPDNALVTVTDVDEPGQPKVTKTVRQWLRFEKRGLLCSTEF